MSPVAATESVVDMYIELGLAVGRHIEGLVDAYYGPPEIAARIEAEPPRPAQRLVSDSRALIAALDGGVAIDGSPDSAPLDGSRDANRRRWLRAQAVGLLTTSRKLADEDISYADEVESCYGVRPHPIEWDEVAEVHKRLDEVVPGSGALGERLNVWRESHAVAPDKLLFAIAALAEILKERTIRQFGLPDGEICDFELVTDKPWSGFNTYLGGLHSRVDINTDLPVLSLFLPHLVAHEAYPGHHTEHCSKEIGLVRNRSFLEETIFLVGTPQCLLTEGLADLGLEVAMGSQYHDAAAEAFTTLGIRFDTETAAAVSETSVVLQAVRATAAWRLHEERADPDTVVSELARWGLLPRKRAEKAVEFLLHPTWRAYITCYVEGYQLCRSFVDGDPGRFSRLLREQLTPADLRQT